MIKDFLKIASILFLANLLVTIIAMVYDAIKCRHGFGNTLEIAHSWFFGGLGVYAIVMLVIGAVAFLIGG